MTRAGYLSRAQFSILLICVEKKFRKKIFNSVVEVFFETANDVQTSCSCVAEQNRCWLVYYACGVSPRLGSPQVVGSNLSTGQKFSETN